MRSGHGRETVGAALSCGRPASRTFDLTIRAAVAGSSGSQASGVVRPARIKSQSVYAARPAGAHKKGAPLRLRGRATIVGQRRSQALQLQQLASNPLDKNTTLEPSLVQVERE